MAIYIILAVLGGIIFGGIFFWFLGRRGGKDGSILMLQDQLKEIRGTLDMKLGESTKAMQEQVRESTRVMQEQSNHTTRIVKEITEKLVEVGEGQKQVVSFADQLKNLQDILTNPKQRGTFGEYHLETELKNVLPAGGYQTQYLFKDGTRADAVIFLDNKKILAIDSKFSLENYTRLLEEKNPVEREKLEKLFGQDLKNRIDETSKYIKPSERTLDYAFMFIPSEAIYYDLVVNKIGAIKSNTRDLMEYAVREKHVIPVSPTTIMAFLQTVQQGLRALHVEESAKEIINKVGDLNRHLRAYQEFLKKLGLNLGTTVNTYNTASKEFQKIDKDVVRITGKSIGSEPLAIDKPEEM